MYNREHRLPIDRLVCSIRVPEALLGRMNADTENVAARHAP